MSAPTAPTRAAELITQLADELVGQITEEVRGRLSHELNVLVAQAEQPTPEQPAPSTSATWMTVAEAAAHARRGDATIRRALSAYVASRGKRGLRGSQQAANCSWRIQRSDLEAWMAGETPKKRRPS
ncbi:MAG TPA: helix-turn-helix domain-containing protein [Pseudonocardiaceae bacterium]|nr:helix-turn-helix domain-containing protein [Pseudonocardiaceae bacterium]